MQRTFRTVLQPEPEGGFTVIVPSLPGSVTYGESLTEAKVMAREAIELYIADLHANGEDIPDDSESLEISLTIT